MNVSKHSQKTMEEVANLFLGNQPRKLGGKLAKDIQFGQMRLGMTKKQVIMAREYSPAHKTPSTELDRWTYSSSMFVQHNLILKKVVSLEDTVYVKSKNFINIKKLA